MTEIFLLLYPLSNNNNKRKQKNFSFTLIFSSPPLSPSLFFTSFLFCDFFPFFPFNLLKFVNDHNSYILKSRKLVHWLNLTVDEAQLSVHSSSVVVRISLCTLLAVALCCRIKIVDSSSEHSLNVA